MIRKQVLNILGFHFSTGQLHSQPLTVRRNSISGLLTAHKELSSAETTTVFFHSENAKHQK